MRDPESIEGDAYLFGVIGAVFILLSILDVFAFVYHPFQTNVIVDFRDKREQDKIML